MSARVIFCRHCRSPKTKKNGRDRNRRQKHKCRECGGVFTQRTQRLTSGSHLSERQWQKAAELFCLRGGISAADLARVLKVNPKTAQRVLRCFRSLCAELVPQDLEGFIEWDETTARKGEWVFGGVSRHLKQCLLRLVPNREAGTLVPLILAVSGAESWHFTDEWGAYNELPDHFTVCHAKEFVSRHSATVHTNTQEGIWGHMKPMGTHIYRGFPKATLKAFLAETMFRYNYRDYEKRVEILSALLKRKNKQQLISGLVPGIKSLTADGKNH